MLEMATTCFKLLLIMAPMELKCIYKVRKLPYLKNIIVEYSAQALNPERKGEASLPSTFQPHVSPNQERVIAFRSRFIHYIDHSTGGLRVPEGMKALTEAVRDESDMALKVESAKMISRTTR